ncbi:MAG: hypothetical protein ACRCX4_12670 [Bacteroidales bacterium]
MKTIKFLAVSLLASSFFISCSNEGETVLDSTPKHVAISLNLPKMAATKGLDDVAAAGAKVTMEGTVLVYARQNQNGAIVNTYTLQVSDFTGTSATTLTKTLEVNGTATYLEVEGNIDNERGRDAGVNTRQGGATSSAVRVTGGNAITPGTGNANGTCAVEVAPEMARLEVIGDLGATNTITDLKINGFYLNNIKEDRTATTLTKLTNASTPAWSVAYEASGSRSKMFDAVTDLTSIEDGKTYGYNFFPQTFTDVTGVTTTATTKEDAAKYHVHMIINVSFKKQDGTAVDNQWLNVVALKDGSNNYFGAFENGKVYQLKLSDIKDIMDVVNPPVTPEPDPNATSVDVTVEVKGWEIVPVKPEV